MAASTPSQLVDHRPGSLAGSHERTHRPVNEVGAQADASPCSFASPWFCLPCHIGFGCLVSAAGTPSTARQKMTSDRLGSTPSNERETVAELFQDRYIDVGTFRARYWTAGNAGSTIVLRRNRPHGFGVAEEYGRLGKSTSCLRLRHARARPDR